MLSGHADLGLHAPPVRRAVSACLSGREDSKLNINRSGAVTFPLQLNHTLSSRGLTNTKPQKDITMKHRAVLRYTQPEPHMQMLCHFNLSWRRCLAVDTFRSSGEKSVAVDRIFCSPNRFPAR